MENLSRALFLLQAKHDFRSLMEERDFLANAVNSCAKEAKMQFLDFFSKVFQFEPVGFNHKDIEDCNADFIMRHKVYNNVKVTLSCEFDKNTKEPNPDKIAIFSIKCEGYFRNNPDDYHINLVLTLPKDEEYNTAYTKEYCRFEYEGKMQKSITPILEQIFN